MNGRGALLFQAALIALCAGMKIGVSCATPSVQAASSGSVYPVTPCQGLV